MKITTANGVVVAMAENIEDVKKLLELGAPKRGRKPGKYGKYKKRRKKQAESQVSIATPGTDQTLITA